MKTFIASYTLALLLMAAPAAGQDASTPVLTCQTGPLTQSYGGTNWLVYSCSDGKAVIIIAAPGNPASPQFFTLRPDGQSVLASGEGTGHQELASKAFAELVKFSASDLAVLVARTRADTVTKTP